MLIRLALLRVALLIIAFAIIRLFFVSIGFIYILSDPIPEDAQEVFSGTAFEVLQEVRARAGMTQKCRLFISRDEYYGRGGIRAGWHDIFILIDPRVEQWPRGALRGLFAHELGHWANGHLTFKSYLYSNLAFKVNDERKQGEADAWAVLTVGRKDLMDCLFKLNTYVSKRVEKFEEVLREKGQLKQAN